MNLRVNENAPSASVTSANHDGTANDRLQTHQRNDAVAERDSCVAIRVRNEVAEVTNVAANYHHYTTIIEPKTNRLALFGPPCVMLVGL